MAERRMFAKTIVTSDAFLDLPASTRSLYFLLGMMADDDGFVNNPSSIMRMSGATTDDLKLLIAKRFVLTFESGVVVIKHWCIHNTIQKDRYKATKYLEEKSKLSMDENKAYSFADSGLLQLEESHAEKKPTTEARAKRQQAKKDSLLPYSFEYKIRNAFVGYVCPICGKQMNYENALSSPTIQHNIPISMGGKHEIDNISVICRSCNSSIQNRIATEPYNTEEVKRVWERIGNGSGMDTQVRLGKDRLVEGRLIESIGDGSDHVETTPKRKRFIPPTLDDVKAYCQERGNNVDPERFMAYYESNGWMVGRNKMKDWKAAVRSWERSCKPSRSGGGNPFLDMMGG